MDASNYPAPYSNQMSHILNKWTRFAHPADPAALYVVGWRPYDPDSDNQFVSCDFRVDLSRSCFVRSRHCKQTTTLLLLFNEETAWGATLKSATEQPMKKKGEHLGLGLIASLSLYTCIFLYLVYVYIYPKVYIYIHIYIVTAFVFHKQA